MRRLHLLEIEDQPWCPRAVRDTLTDTLHFTLSLGRVYAPAAAYLRRALERTGTTTIVDLCSGGGGPWPDLLQQLDGTAGAPAEVILTDWYPNLLAFERARQRAPGRVRFRTEPVDATRVPPDLVGVRTLFTSFHHFAPEQARAILADAVKRRQGIVILEIVERRLRAILSMVLAPLVILLAVPFLRPFRWSRLLWTYLIPLAPTAALVDGVVSCMRAYTPTEFRELARDVGATDYVWEVGTERGGLLPLSLTCLVGYPGTPGSSRQS